ncbi:hypothetical protein [Micromonospora sp. NBC_00421]|uniref:hypothetical protein n=1 Tax=Micromonospora sp. NBC_00421 TaxID=2975976 RepID=UPI002E1C2143
MPTPTRTVERRALLVDADDGVALRGSSKLSLIGDVLLRQAMGPARRAPARRAART